MDTSAVCQAPTEDEVKTLLTEKFPQVEVTGTETRRVYAKAPREISKEVCVFIHDNLTFEHCSTVIGVDYVDHLTVVYHLSNYWNGLMIELSVDLDLQGPESVRERVLRTHDDPHLVHSHLVGLGLQLLFGRDDRC